MKKQTFLSDFRESKGYTQEDISTILEISVSFYTKIEKGERNPSYNFLNKLKVNFPDVSIDSVFFTANNT